VVAGEVAEVGGDEHDPTVHRPVGDDHHVVEAVAGDVADLLQVHEPRAAQAVQGQGRRVELHRARGAAREEREPASRQRVPGHPGLPVVAVDYDIGLAVSVLVSDEHPEQTGVSASLRIQVGGGGVVRGVGRVELEQEQRPGPDRAAVHAEPGHWVGLGGRVLHAVPDVSAPRQGEVEDPVPVPVLHRQRPARDVVVEEAAHREILGDRFPGWERTLEHLSLVRLDQQLLPRPMREVQHLHPSPPPHSASVSGPNPPCGVGQLHPVSEGRIEDGHSVGLAAEGGCGVHEELALSNHKLRAYLVPFGARDPGGSHVGGPVGVAGRALGDDEVLTRADERVGRGGVDRRGRVRRLGPGARGLLPLAGRPPREDAGAHRGSRLPTVGDGLDHEGTKTRRRAPPASAPGITGAPGRRGGRCRGTRRSRPGTRGTRRRRWGRRWRGRGGRRRRGHRRRRWSPSSGRRPRG
jgi:hypothetical protein